MPKSWYLYHGNQKALCRITQFILFPTFPIQQFMLREIPALITEWYISIAVMSSTGRYVIGWCHRLILVISPFDADDIIIWYWWCHGILSFQVSLLVMTFAVKENHEVSYTKNESANKMTEWVPVLFILQNNGSGHLNSRYCRGLGHHRFW